MWTLGISLITASAVLMLRRGLVDSLVCMSCPKVYLDQTSPCVTVKQCEGIDEVCSADIYLDNQGRRHMHTQCQAIKFCPNENDLTKEIHKRHTYLKIHSYEYDQSVQTTNDQMGSLSNQTEMVGEENTVKGIADVENDRPRHNSSFRYGAEANSYIHLCSECCKSDFCNANLCNGGQTTGNAPIGGVANAPEVHLVSSTQTIVPGVTVAMTMTCSLMLRADSTLASVISLVLLKRNITTAKMDAIASIDTFHPNTVNTLTKNTGTSASGHVGNRDGYVQVNWSYPSDANSGQYQCEANTLDHNGHPVRLTKDLTVYHEQIDVSSLAIQLAFLKDQMTQMAAITSQQSSLIQEIKLNLTDVTQRLEVAHATIARHENEIEILKGFHNQTNLDNDETYHSSDIVHGRKYLLSKSRPKSFHDAQVACAKMNGYLVEINNQVELFDIQRFLGQVSPAVIPNHCLLIGLNDRQVEGQWVNSVGHDRGVFASWGQGEPSVINGVEQDCCVLSTTAWEMKVEECVLTSDNVCGGDQLQFLCEVPFTAQ